MSDDLCISDYVMLTSLVGRRMAELARRAPCVLVNPARRTIATTKPRRGGGDDHGWTYRSYPAPPPARNYTASWAIMTVTWWWIFHGILTEPAHIFGFWDNYPEPENWTDEELGIPPDDE